MIKKAIIAAACCMAVVALADCVGKITGTTVDDCTASPCTTLAASPAVQVCGVSYVQTGKTCVYGTNKYTTTITTYTNGMCISSQCQGAQWAGIHKETNSIPELLPCGG